VPARTSALDTLVFGVDVHSGDVRGTAPSYALVRYRGEAGGGDHRDAPAIERDVVSGRKLERAIHDAEPDLIATDNAYELAADGDALVRFLRDLPHGTRLVQVTGDERPEPLSRVAHRHGVPYGDDPMSEAEAAARLAAANVGHVVSAFADRTTVRVSRGRSTGGGGWSEDRHTRRVHGAVKRRAREVASALDDAGLDYERDATEKYGGFANAAFAVEAAPGDLPVSSERRDDVRIEVERERRDGIVFEPLAERRDHVLVGVDPGTTTAVALVSLDGAVLDVLSTRTADAAAITEWIVERGRPVLVAADVTPMPDTVEKLRRSFDAAGWTPDTDLPVDEKQHRTRDAGYDNDHERDAIAAALFAHDAHADQFERVARKTPPELERGAVIGRVLVEEESPEAAVDALGEGDDETGDGDGPDDDASPAPSPEQRTIARLEERIDRLEAHVDDLQDTVAEKEDRIADLQAELDDARREERRDAKERRSVARLRRRNDALQRELDDRDERIEALEDKVDRMKALWRLDHSNFSDVSAEKKDLVPVKPVAKFTDDAIDAAQSAYGLAADDVLLLRDATGAGAPTAERLADLDPRVVLTNGGLSDAADRVLFEREVPVGPADDVAMQEVDELAVARESDVEAAIDDWRERAAERRRERREAMVDQVIDEHRADRRSTGD
jgi:predicted RNase H-like nuclease (RuvC/YqgF family)